jgi:hypothetical protein
VGSIFEDGSSIPNSKCSDPAVHLPYHLLGIEGTFRDAGESVLPDFAELDRMKMRVMAATATTPGFRQGERVDLKGKSEPLYPRFLMHAISPSFSPGKRKLLW